MQSRQHSTAYRGRFAPSPTGPLHFGSLVAALGSFLDARRHGGEWLVRMEDLDRQREVPGAADHILRTLDAFGFAWDGPVLRQSDRTAAYAEALDQLRRAGLLFACACSRAEIARRGRPGPEGRIYPGTCRAGLPTGHHARALRIRIDGAAVGFQDRFQGHIRQDLEQEVGDFVVRRADGVHAYQLAVVVDDAHQRITQVVRGADLVLSTPRQIYPPAHARTPDAGVRPSPRRPGCGRTQAQQVGGCGTGRSAQSAPFPLARLDFLEPGIISRTAGQSA